MKLELPSSWEHITIRQFIEINAVKEKGFEELELIIEVLSILTGVERQKLEKISLTSLTKAYSYLKWMDSFEMPDKIEPVIKVNGKKYLAKLDIRKISGGQYLDLKTYTKDPKNILDNIHNILSVFYITPGKDYNDDDYNASEVGLEFYDYCPITVAYPVALFFWTLLSKWSSLTAEYLEKETMKRMKTMIA